MRIRNRQFILVYILVRQYSARSSLRSSVMDIYIALTSVYTPMNTVHLSYNQKHIVFTGDLRVIYCHATVTTYHPHSPCLEGANKLKRNNDQVISTARARLFLRHSKSIIRIELRRNNPFKTKNKVDRPIYHSNRARIISSEHTQLPS
jgi:hypothetical protein